MAGTEHVAAQRRLQRIFAARCRRRDVELSRVAAGKAFKPHSDDSDDSGDDLPTKRPRNALAAPIPLQVGLVQTASEQKDAAQKAQAAQVPDSQPTDVAQVSVVHQSDGTTVIRGKKLAWRNLKVAAPPAHTASATAQNVPAWTASDARFEKQTQGGSGPATTSGCAEPREAVRTVAGVDPVEAELAKAAQLAAAASAHMSAYMQPVQGTGAEMEWEIVWAGGARVRARPDCSSEQLTVHPPGMIIRGGLQGNWVELMEEPGFIMVTSGEHALLRSVPIGTWAMNNTVVTPAVLALPAPGGNSAPADTGLGGGGLTPSEQFAMLLSLKSAEPIKAGSDKTLMTLAEMAEEAAAIGSSAVVFCASPEAAASAAHCVCVAEVARLASHRGKWANNAVSAWMPAESTISQDWIRSIKQICRQSFEAAQQSALDCAVHAGKVAGAVLSSRSKSKSPVPCKFFFAQQQCMQGDGCEFSHDPLDLQPRPLALKNERVCQFFERGSCWRGKSCPFAHGPEELQEIAQAKTYVADATRTSR